MDPEFKYEIEGYDEIPVACIRPNPDNPRPTFHLGDDDPALLALGDSIRTTYQHRPAVVFELKGYAKYPDEPGQFMLLQGERRWRACKLANVDTMRCLIARTPSNEVEEHSWLGNEEAFKEDWGRFFVLRYAKGLAEKLDLPMVHTDIANRTGLSIEDLRLGAKIFQLEPEMQALVAEHEELNYQKRLTGKKGRLGRVSGIETREFSVPKAALVYDIYALLREHLTKTVERLDNAELQRIIAAKNASHNELDDMERMLRESGGSFQSGQLGFIDQWLFGDLKTGQLLKATGSSHTGKLKRFMKQISAVDTLAHQLTAAPDQFGANLEVLKENRTELLSAVRSIDRLERMLEDRIRQLEG